MDRTNRSANALQLGRLGGAGECVLDGLNSGLLDQLGQFLGEGSDTGANLLVVRTLGNELQCGWRGRAVGTALRWQSAFNG